MTDRENELLPVRRHGGLVMLVRCYCCIDDENVRFGPIVKEIALREI